MLCWRWAGERRSARPTRPDTPDGMIQENCGRSGALPWSRTSRTSSSLPPKKRFPKSISNTRSPSAKTSLRGSVRLPASCSGAEYGTSAPSAAVANPESIACGGASGRMPPVQRLGVVEGLDQVIPLRLLSEVQHRHDVVVPEPDRPPDGILDERELRGIVGQRRGEDGHGEEVAEERVSGLVRRPRRAVAELLQHLVPAGAAGVALPRRGFDSSVVSRSLQIGRASCRDRVW